MQRDLKIGISLCVLMFGVVGAFLFRREQPKPNTQSLQSKTEKQLDQKIAQKSNRPYSMQGVMGDIETDDTEDSHSQSGASEGHADHLHPPSALIEEDGVFSMHGRRSRGIGRSGIGATPIQPRGEGAPRIVPENVTTGPQTHTIQAGDTLSSISEKYLGNRNRFQEIFDANRMVLTNPNRLPEGVVISIPAAKDVRRISDTGSNGHQGTHEARRPHQNLEQIKPISPEHGRDSASVSEAFLDDESEKSDKATGSGKSAEKKAAETKKRFFAPSRLPFGNPGSTQTKIPDLSINAVPESRDNPQPESADPEHESAKQVYRVRKGDSLERISQRVYGNPRQASEIFKANRDKLTTPNSVREGLELELP